MIKQHYICHIFDSYQVSTTFRIFLRSFLILENMFFSYFVVGFEKPSLRVHYNASIVRNTSTILATSTHLLQDMVATNYFCILLRRTLLILSV
jgi:hypothetical protein